MIFKRLFHPRPGVTLLMAVVIVGTITLATTLSVAMWGINEAIIVLKEGQSINVLSVADSCMEEALIQISYEDHSFTGSTLDVDGGTCVSTVTRQGTIRKLEVEATVGEWTRSHYAEITLYRDRMILSEWKQQAL